MIKAVSENTTEASAEVVTAEDLTNDSGEHFEERFDLVEEEWQEDEPALHMSWLAPALALLTIIGWTAFYVWAHQDAMLAGGTPQDWTTWITSWSIPVLLVVSLWMLAVRNSRHEARRFGEVARLLSEESTRLEAKLATVNRELSLAREFLGSQAQDLEYLGRSASDRISEHADRLQSLIHDNGQQVDAIARVSGTALENMDRLRDNLPVIANSAKDVSNQIGSAGRTAKAQLDELVAGFKRLNEFGSASERQVLSLRERIDEALTAFEAQADQLATITEHRFALLREESETFRGELDSREIDALAAMRARAESLRSELSEAGEATSAEQAAAMDALRSRLEVLRSEASDITSSIRSGEDVALAAWSGQVEELHTRLRDTIEEISRIDNSALESAKAKLKALFDEAEEVDDRIAERNRLFEVQTTQRQSRFDEAEQKALAIMHERLIALDTALSERHAAQIEQADRLVSEGEALSQRLGALGETFRVIEAQGRDASTSVAAGLDALSSRLVESREALDGTDMAVAALTDSSVRLLELIQASARQSRDELPKAMVASEERLARIESRAAEVQTLLDRAREAGDAAAASMETADGRARAAMEDIDRFQATFGETAAAQVASIERLRASVAALGAENEAVAQKAQAELRAAIGELESSARKALVAIEDEQSERIAKLANQVGDQSTQAIERALAEHTEAALSKLDEATGRSSQAGREIMRQLRDQLAKVNELTGNLESRIAHARERATEHVDNDFSRRVALISESLNSNAIDIAKALSTEVTDTAWASYLRGDRGIFTRRAVRLLDNTEAREIAELYDTDHDFREHVSRYIHDFEAMLRTMLSTREGDAVAVTLLSGDMGKLYVILAQALERLRQ
ncbi:ATPase [Qipengyuania sp. 6B39]|uniref:ATPase n=1 Tax=Qipengyuania proteolytica TaxID=2867239 RepID=UPI001C8AEAEC|nr:ATPase [Qipengyuania proteolytica]MBX7496172.1 ATPase [Qipengyuania proteolytica]